MTWDVAGSVVLGIVVMYISMVFIMKAVETDATAKNLAAFIAILLGGTAVEFLSSKIGANQQNFAQYSVGLGIGLLLYLILWGVGRRQPSTPITAAANRLAFRA